MKYKLTNVTKTIILGLALSLIYIVIIRANLQLTGEEAGNLVIGCTLWIINTIVILYKNLVSLDTSDCKGITLIYLLLLITLFIFILITGITGYLTSSMLVISIGVPSGIMIIIILLKWGYN